MARISTYGQDSTLNKLDKVLGTDSATGGTKNFTLDSILGLVNDENLVETFDGAAFEFQNYVDPTGDPQGVINLNAGTASNASFSAINTLYISVKDKSGSSLAEYLENADNDFIKISKTDNLNQFGIYEVTAITDYGDSKYKKLTLTPRGTNGTLTVGTKYFVANYSALYDQDFSDDSVTEFGDVTSAGSGEIITTTERQQLQSLNSNALVHNDVVDNVTSTSTDVPLSANQGKILKDLIDTINALLISDNVNLDSLQEVVDFIEANKDTLDNLAISNIAGLQAALDSKENAVVGKGLSANDFTDTLLTKLNNIAENAEVNVNADWSAVSGDAFIQNKPTDLTNLSLHNATDLSDITDAGSGAIITSAERTKLSGIESGAQVNVKPDWTAAAGNAAEILNKPSLAPSNAEQNVQVDWNENDTASDAHILNKPSVALSTTTIEVAGTANEVEVSPTGAQDLSTNRTFTVGLPDDVTVTGDLTVGETIELTNTQTTTPTFDNGVYYKTENGHDTLHFRYHGHDLSIDKLTEILPSGILNGGELTKANNTQFTIAAGDGIINILNKDNSDPHPEIKSIEWSQQTVTVSNLDSGNSTQLNSWIYVDATGTVQQQSSAFTEAQFRNVIPIGSAIHTAGVLQFVRTFPRTAYNQMSQHSEFIAAFGPLKKSGHKVTANGTNLSIDRSAGVAFSLGRNYVTDPENPSTISDGAKTAAVIHRYRGDGSGGFVKDTNSGSGYTTLDPTKYDSGSGSLNTVSGGHYSVQRLFYFPSTPDIIISYYAKGEYNSMDEAEKNYLLETFTEADNTAQQAIYLGAIIMSGGATDLSNSSQAKILTAGTFRSLAATNLGGVAANATLSDLGDVTVTGPSNGQVLKYDSSQQLWVNATDEGGIALTDLSVGAEGTPSGNGSVDYDNTTGVFTYTPPDASGSVAGTTGKIAKFTGANAVGDSLVSETASATAISLTKVTGLPSGSGSFYTGFTAPPNGNTGGEQTTVDCSSDPFGESTGDVSYIRLDFASESEADSFRNLYSIPDGVFGTDATSLAAETTFSFTFTNGASLVFTQPAGGIFYNDGDSIFLGSVYQALPGQDGGNTLSYVSGSGSITTGDVLTAVSASAAFVSVSGQLDMSTNKIVNAVDPTEDQDVATKAYVDANSSSPGGTVVKKTFSGDGSNRDFLLDDAIVAKSNVDVYVNGVYQFPSNYEVSGSTVTFDADAIPASGTDNVSITHVVGTIATEGSSMQKASFTGDGTTTTFDLSDTPQAKSFTIVHIEGIYQESSAYSISGSDIVFTTAPSNGHTVEVTFIAGTISIASLDVGSQTINSFTGTGTATSFDLGTNVVSDKNYTDVYINGVYQAKNTYSLSGTNIVFSTAPQNGYSIEVKCHSSSPNNVTNSTTMVSDVFTADGVTSTFALTNGSPSSEEFTMVFVSGIYQQKSAYNLVGSSIVFQGENPAEDDTVEVISLSSLNNTSSPVSSVNGQTGAVVVASKHNVSVISSDTNATANTLYVFTANLNLTLPASPESGDSIKISNRSTVDTCQLLRNGNNILGAAADLTLDTTAASFELVYTDTANGWVIIGQ